MTEAEILAKFDLTMLAAMKDARDRYEIVLKDSGATDEEVVAALALQDSMMLESFRDNRAEVQRLLRDPDAPTHKLQ